MTELRLPSFEHIGDYLASGLVLYAGLMMSLLTIGHLAMQGVRRPRLSIGLAARLPGMLLGMAMAAGVVVALHGAGQMLSPR